MGREVQREGVVGRGVSIAAGGGRSAGAEESGGGFEVVVGFAGRFFARMRVSSGYTRSGDQSLQEDEGAEVTHFSGTVLFQSFQTSQLLLKIPHIDQHSFFRLLAFQLNDRVLIA